MNPIEALSLLVLICLAGNAILFTWELRSHRRKIRKWKRRAVLTVLEHDGITTSELLMHVGDPPAGRETTALVLGQGPELKHDGAGWTYRASHGDER